MDDTENNEVCPACAGMIRAALVRPSKSTSLPRMRGDDPTTGWWHHALVRFAPHARG